VNGDSAAQLGGPLTGNELLTGSVPFKREDPMMVLYAHAYADPPLLTAARPDLPAAVDAVLARGLAKQPDRRYDSCGDFADALREALGLEPYDPRRPPRPATPRSRRPRQSQCANRRRQRRLRR
jgi:serine/threonine protein kinase